MPPLFRMRITVNRDVLDGIRSIPVRTQRNFKRKLQTELKPELQEDTNALTEQGPEPVSSPFEFGTEKSRQKYFWIIRHELGLEDDPQGHWPRRGIVEHGFDVNISDRLIENLILIRNIQPEAKYVLGPWQVAGHKNTGWDEWIEFIRQIIREKAIRRILELWRESLREAVREKR